MGTTGIRGTQIKDETVKSIDIASGSIKKGEVSSQVISSQATIDSVDTSNDMLLIYDANNDALKKVAPTNLGVGGSGSPGGSDTQVQYNNGGSFGGATQLIYDDSNHRLGIGSTSAPDYTLDVAGNIGVDQYIYHNGDGNTLINFTDDKIILKAGGKAMITMEEKGSAPHEITLNDGGNNIDFVVKGNGSNAGNPAFKVDASNNRVGINGVGDPSVELDVSGDVNFDGAAVFNESSADKDFRVESNGNANMLFVNGGTDRVGIGTDTPLTTLHISGAAATDSCITIQGQADAGIRLAADKANGDEGNNPYIDWYQDGQNPTSRNNRVAVIAMEGDAGTAFTGSLANSLFVDTFCPNSQQSNVRRFQIATDCSSSSDGANHSARLTIEGGHGYVGLHTNAATSPLHVYSNESGNFAALIDNDNGSSGHGLKVTSDGTGTGTNLLDVEAASTTVFRVRGDGRVGIGKVSSLPAAVLTVSSSNTDGDIAVAHKIQHIGDSDTYIEFADDEIALAAGGRTFIKIEEASTDKLIINNGGLDIDLKVSGENLANLIRTDAANDRVGIGTSSPDGILHIDNGTSNTEVIIEKDAGTSGSIVFHNAGTREADIAFSTNEDIEITNWVADKDITLNIVSGSTEAAALTIDASTGALIANKQFARGVASLNLGSGTTSTIDPSVEGAGTILVTCSSITVPTSEPNESQHICSIPDGKIAGQILTVCLITDCLDGSTGLDSMGALIFGMDTPIPSSRALTTMGSALGGTPQGASFTLLWTGSGWMVLSTFGGIS